MNINLREVPLFKLATILDEAYIESNQEKINTIAYEIACRLYVPENGEVTFEDLLQRFGYVKIEKNDEKVLKRRR